MLDHIPPGCWIECTRLRTANGGIDFFFFENAQMAELTFFLKTPNGGIAFFLRTPKWLNWLFFFLKRLKWLNWLYFFWEFQAVKLNFFLNVSVEYRIVCVTDCPTPIFMLFCAQTTLRNETPFVLHWLRRYRVQESTEAFFFLFKLAPPPILAIKLELPATRCHRWKFSAF